MEAVGVQIQHVMSDEEKVEACRHATDIVSAMDSLAELCELVSGHEQRAKAVMPVIIQVARSTAARADMIHKLIVN